MVLKKRYIETTENGKYQTNYIKNRTYCSFNDMIYIENFDSKLLKIDTKSYKNIDTYYIGYITIKYFDYVRINNANPLYLIIGKADGYIEEKNGNKYLIFASTDKNKEVLTINREVWDEINYLIKTINGGEAGEYEEKHIKIRYNSDDNLPLNKVLNIHNLTIVVHLF